MIKTDICILYAFFRKIFTLRYFSRRNLRAWLLLIHEIALSL